MKYLHPIILLLGIMLTSCNGGEPNLPYTYNTNPKYSWGYAEFFGHEYAQYGINNNLLSLSLFSDSLRIDSTGTLVGTGQYLFLEDVYVAPTDTLLPQTTYTISNSHEPYTILAGKNDTVGAQVFPIGAYISYYEENTSKSMMKFITQGNFTLTYSGSNNCIIVCTFKTADKKVLKGTFTGKLQYFDESLKTRQKVKRLNHKFIRLY